MEYSIDAHTHTIASGHAYSTIQEMAKAAADKNLKILGITEHTESMPGSCHRIYFTNLKVIDRKMYGVELLFGAELNIIGYDGKVDLPGWIIKKLDLSVASVHNLCLGAGTKQNNTAAVINAMKNPLIDIIGHPDDGAFPMDYLEIAKAAKEYKTLIELNNSSLSPNSFRENAKENNIELLSHCKRMNVPIVIDSDAHYSSWVGNHQYADEVIKIVDFPQELIMNYYPEKFKKKILKYKNK
jgi:putative hydrolase